jgi:hypothetical protein
LSHPSGYWERDTKQVAHFSIEIGKSGLRPTKHADLHVTLRREPLAEDAECNRLAGAGIAGDESKAAFAGELLDPPAKGLDARRDVERLGRHVRSEGVPFETIEREQLCVHCSSPWSFSSLGR